jgi:hypothetical protein
MAETSQQQNKTKLCPVFGSGLLSMAVWYPGKKKLEFQRKLKTSMKWVGS